MNRFRRESSPYSGHAPLSTCSPVDECKEGEDGGGGGGGEVDDKTPMTGIRVAAVRKVSPPLSSVARYGTSIRFVTGFESFVRTMMIPVTRLFAMLPADIRIMRESRIS